VTVPAADAADLPARLRLADAVAATVAAAVVTAATLAVAAHTTWVWGTLCCLLLAGVCYLHVTRLHALLPFCLPGGYAAGGDQRGPLAELWWWHFTALVLHAAAFPAAIAWLFANGPLEVVTANLTMVVMVFAVRSCWRSLGLTHHRLMELAQH
jgi:hypothetical protein